MARRESQKLIEVLRRMSEEGIASFFNEVMANDALRRAFASAGERFISNKSRFDRNVETLLDFINLPSKRDIRELKSRIDHLNGQLLNLNLKVDRLTGDGQGAGAATPRRRTTRRKHD
jgi:polyhydroxyalkanoate synthesis regulator phasin